MATFSVNQVRHLYVANKVDSTYSDKGVWNPADAKVAGTADLHADKNKKHIYLNYIGAAGKERSDLIEVANIMHVEAVDAAKQETSLKQVTVTLDSSINEGNPVSGQDYLLRITISPYVGMSDEDILYKHGVVHAYAGMSASDFYKKLAISLVKNFSREVWPLLTFALKTASGTVELDNTTKEASLTDTYTGVIITEAEQDWQLGTIQQEFVNFTVNSDQIIVNGDEVFWGIVEETESGVTVNNGKKIADLEYFCMGARGDIYRNMGWPNVIHTKYLVDPEQPYHSLNIHYSYVGDNHNPQKSEKDITIVSTDKEAINTLINELNEATGLEVATL